jgi:superfamily II DNA or RNA helicase
MYATQSTLSLPLGGPVAHGTLRPYQDAHVHRALSGLNKHRSGLVVSPTGTGKTICIAEMCRRIDQGRILLLAESRQILRQMQRTVSRWCGEDVGLEQAENCGYGQRIVCASRQTLAGNDLRLEKYRRNPPTTIIIDEAHHACARQYRKILEAFPDARVVGFTATPDRGDKKALGQVFETNFSTYEIHEAVSDGWLVPVETARIKNWDALDISRIKKVAGELHEGELEKLLAEVVKDQAAAGVEAVGDKKAIWFCGRVETAHQLAACIDTLVGKSGAARAVDGGMIDDEKDEILDAFKASQFQHLVNVGICTEGFDCPDAVAAVLTRPYLSRGRFTQAVGRVLRPVVRELESYATAADRKAAIALSQKPRALLVNFRYLKGKHTLVCPEDVLGGKYDEEVKALAQALRDQGEADTVDESLQKAQQKVDDARAQREAELKRKAALAAEAQRKAQAEWGTFDAFEGVPWFDESGQPFSSGWREPAADPITPKQRNFLKHGMRVPEHEIPKTKNAASRLIGQLKAQGREPRWARR